MNNEKRLGWRLLVVTVCTLWWSAVAYADLILTAPPRESAELGEQLYGPLARLLTNELGVRVVYEHSTDWLEYSAKMRKDKFDIIFDGPHFAAWRMKHLNHTPVAKVPGTLAFVVVGREEDQAVNGLRDVVSGRLCGMASPNLGTLAVLSQFQNPIVQPDVFEAQDVADVYMNLQSRKCATAVFQDKFLGKLPYEERKKLKIIFATNQYPDQTITVSKRVTGRQRAVLTELLTRPGGLEATHELLKRYARQATSFEAPHLQEYAGLENLLEGVVWGW
jgi:ABC-type phosphate/phosphonate transport system substrate-binding protein